MNRILSIALSCILVSSCVNDVRERNITSLSNFQIDFKNATELNFEEKVDTFYYIPLETGKNNLLGEITKIQVDSVISVLDGMNQTIHLYSLNGKLMTVIDKKGMGPGEYVQLGDFYTSYKDRYVELLDPMKKKVMRYDFSGNFIKEISLPFPNGVSRFTKFNGYYVFDQQTRRNNDKWKYSIVVISEDGKIINKFFPYTKYADILLSSRTSFYNINNELHYVPIYCDTIFALDENSVSPKFSVDFSDKWVDESFVYSEVKNPMDFINKLKDCDFITFLNVLETDSTIWLDFMYKEQKYCALINKRNLNVSTYSIHESKDYGNLMGEVLTSWNNYFIMPINAEQLNQKLGLKGENDNNPYIVFVKFKS
ncbi:6-bladed beta-propeller [uncultured Bacteroides sp.]|uniref:6-bladed beta-propeller n=1 Tax=uncultured Bacteroides sp. TaxID=162156 RepID=UPI00280AD43E|nr:6-bladed beta-propeller [uncultured Bacteroides sp.]